MDSAVLFDYNGVIVGDEHLQYQAMRDVLAKYGGVLTQEMYDKLLLGRPDKAGFESLQDIFPQLQSKSVSDLVQEKVATYRRILAAESIVFPAIKPLLDALQTKYSLGVVTGSLASEVLPVLEGADLLGYFECVITADQIVHGKPSPEGYLMGADALAIEPKNIVVIEDTPSGVAAAKAAGMKCIALEHSVSADQLEQADIVITTIAGVTPAIIGDLLASV